MSDTVDLNAERERGIETLADTIEAYRGIDERLERSGAVAPPQRNSS